MCASSAGSLTNPIQKPHQTHPDQPSSLGSTDSRSCLVSKSTPSRSDSLDLLHLHLQQPAHRRPQLHMNPMRRLTTKSKKATRPSSRTATDADWVTTGGSLRRWPTSCARRASGRSSSTGWAWVARRGEVQRCLRRCARWARRMASKQSVLLPPSGGVFRVALFLTERPLLTVFST